MIYVYFVYCFYGKKCRNNILVLFLYSVITIYLLLRATLYKTAQSQTTKLGALRHTVVDYLNTCRPTCASFRPILIAFQIKGALMKLVTIV